MLSLELVKDVQSLPPHLASFPSMVDCCNRGQLWLMNIGYDTAGVLPIDVHDKLDLTLPGKLGCVTALRQVETGSKI